MYIWKYRIIDKCIRGVEGMLKTYCFTWNDGDKTTVKDVKRLDDTHNTYSLYSADDTLIISIPIMHIRSVMIVDERLTKAEGSE